MRWTRRFLGALRLCSEFAQSFLFSSFKGAFSRLSMAALKGKGVNTQPSTDIVTRKLFGLPGRICLNN
jgi:hypothetical protein